MDGQRYLRAMSTPAISCSMNVAAGSVIQDDGFNIKEERGDTDLDIGPIVLQHMDTHYRTNQRDISAVKQESIINDINLIRGSRVKEIIEDEWRGGHLLPPGSLTPEEVVMKDTRLCHALQSVQLKIHKDRLASICRVQLRRLDTFQCEFCDFVHTDKRRLLQHSLHVHGSCSQTSLHIKSRNLNNQLTAAVTASQCSNKMTQSEQRARPQFYSCDKCVKTFSSKDYFRKHCRYAHLTESHKCTECNKKFTWKSYLYKHVRYAHSTQQYECAACKKICKSKQALTVHVSRHHRPWPAGFKPRIYICDYCKKTFTIKTCLQNHITCLHTSISYKCSECNKSFKCEQYLMKHTARNHTPGAYAQLYRCDQCLKTFNTKAYLKIHCRRLHGNESHKCTKCNKEYKCKAYLLAHVHNVHSEQQYECAICKTMCKSKQVLSLHVSKHHRNKSAGSVTSQENLTEKPGTSAASQSVHLKIQKKRLCPIFGVQLRRAHTFQCEVCNVGYANRHKLLQHIQEEHGPAPQRSLYRHVKSPQRSNGRQQYATESHQQSTCSIFGKDFKLKKLKWNFKQHEGHGKCTHPTVDNLSAVANTSKQHCEKEGRAHGEPRAGPSYVPEKEL